MEGWMDGWMEAKAGLRIAYSNQKQNRGAAEAKKPLLDPRHKRKFVANLDLIVVPLTTQPLHVEQISKLSIFKIKKRHSCIGSFLKLFNCFQMHFLLTTFFQRLIIE